MWKYNYLCTYRGVRLTDYKKYELILSKLALGVSQSNITIECSCSFGTISRAKKWAENGKIVKSKIPKNSSSKNNSSSVDNSSSVKNSSSEFPKDIGIDLNDVVLGPEGITYNSRFLSWECSILNVPNYWVLSKESMKKAIIDKISKL